MSTMLPKGCTRKSAAVAHEVGMLLLRDGKPREAVPWLKQAVELAPASPGPWADLAEAHAASDEHDQAIPCWERVLRLDPKHAEAHRKLGRAFQEEGRLEDALASFHQAEELEPRAAVTYLHQGTLHEERGQFAHAEAAFRTALRMEPDYPLPHAMLATLLRGKLPDADRTALEARLARSDLTNSDRATLLFAQAHVHDARGDYAGAAACLREANAFRREQPPAYDPVDHECFVNGVLERFDADFFARTVGGGLATRRPVFVVGLPRSGTTLIEQILASHPQVHGAGELRQSWQSFQSLPEVVNRSGPPIVCAARLDDRAVRELAVRHEERLARIGRGKRRVVDKMPDNYIYLGFLAALFPRATFIHCRRDLRDVAVSCWMTDFRKIRWANDPSHLAHRFAQYRRVLAHWRRVLPVPLHEVDYEETVANLEGVARRLLAACGLDWHPSCLEFHRTERPVGTASAVQVRQPLYRKSAGRWRNYENELADLLAGLPRSPTEWASMHRPSLAWKPARC